MDYFYFNFNGISSRNYNLVIQNSGEDLSFPSQPNFENQLVSPIYQNTNYLAGVNTKERIFNFNCWVDSISLEKVRELVAWLSVDNIGDLILDYNPNFKYKVKLQSISEFKHFPVNEDGTSNYEFTISFITIGDFAALSLQTLSFDTNNYISETPIGINNDNGGPVTFNDLNYQTLQPEFKILNYYSEPIDLDFIINSTTSGSFSVKLNDVEYYNYTNNTEENINYFINSKTGIVTINTSLNPYLPQFELAESIDGVVVNTNLGRMSIPSGESQIIMSSIAAKDPNFPFAVQFLDTNSSLQYDLYDIASGNLYVVIQDGNYGDNSTTSYDPIQPSDYIYNKINKDGTNSNIVNLHFNTEQSQPVMGSGELAWNKKEGTLDLGLSEDFVLQIGEELFYYVKCTTALQGNPFGPISKGDAVMFAGFDEYQNILVVKASYSVLAEYPFFYLGIASANIEEGAKGYVTLFGRLGGLDFTYPAGTVLYVDPMVPGGLTSTKPDAPLRNIIVGAAILPDIGGAGVGQIIVSTTQSQGILNLYDVVATSGHPLTGDTLIYQESLIPGYPGVWITSPSVNAAGGITVQDQAEVFSGTNVESVLKEIYDTKVAKATGYDLISNADKTKLDGIATGAEVNVQADWSEVNSSSDSYIKNKPLPYSLPIASTTILGGVKSDGATISIDENGIITSLTSGGTVTSITGNLPITIEDENTTPIISILNATIDDAGAMSAEDKLKLDNISLEANKNVQVDWNEIDILSDSYIKNKPSIPTQYTDQDALNAVDVALYDTQSISLSYDINTNTLKAEANFGTGAGKITEGNDYRLSDSRNPNAHVHGNISNLGQIGAEADLVVVTGPNGVLTTTSRSSIDSRQDFPPSTHTHPISDIVDLQSVLDTKALTPTNQSTALDGYVLTSNGDGSSTFQESSAFYVLPAATSENLGGIKVGDNLTINNGVLSWTPAGTTSLAELLTVSTGVYEFAGLTKVDDTHFSVGAAKGFIVDNTVDPSNPVVIYIEYEGIESIEDTNIGLSYQTQVFLKSDNTLLLDTTSLPACPQRRDAIYLGRIVHPVDIITAVENTPDFVQSPVSQLRDLWKGIGVINDKNYVYPNDNPSTNLSLGFHGGTLYSNGINYIDDPKRPNRKTMSSQSLLTFNYRTQTGLGSNGVTVLDPTYYDNAGTITAVPNPGATSTNQRVYLSPTGLVLIQYGQTLYSDLDDAIAAVSTESFVVASAIEANAVLIGVISISKNATNLTSTYAKFHTVSKFGELSGSAAGGGAAAGSGIASDIEFTPFGAIESTNVQDAIEELETKKVNINSPTFTGNVVMPSGVVFGDPVGIKTTIGDSSIYIDGNKVWHAGNDGSGSGLDADTLDGNHASAFAAVSHTHAQSDITNLTTDLAAKASLLTTTETITVGTGGQYATINAALAYATKKYPTYVSASTRPRITISLLSGFVMAEQVLVDGIDLSWITISSVDAEVSITRSALTIANADSRYPAFTAQNGAFLPIINTLFNMDTSGTATNRHGIMAFNNSRAIILSGKGVKNAGSNGIYAYQSSTISANGAIFSGAGNYGIYAVRGSTINASGANVSYAFTVGVYANFSSTIEFSSGNAQRAGYNTSDVLVNANAFGIYANASSTMNATSANASYSGIYGVYAQNNSRINFADGTATNTGNHSVIATGNSIISAQTSNCSTDGDPLAEYRCITHSFIDISGALGEIDTSPSLNIYESNGLITNNIGVINTNGSLSLKGGTLTGALNGTSATFTGTVALPSTTSIGNVSSTELGYLDGVTSAIQTQLNAKAPTESPVFSGTISASSLLIGNIKIPSSTLAQISSENPPLQVGIDIGQNIMFDKVKIQARDTFDIAPLYLNPMGGGVLVGASGLSTSGPITASSFNGVESSSLLNYTVNTSTSNVVLTGFTLNSGSTYKLYLNIKNTTFNTGDLSLYATYGEPTNYHTQKILSNGTTTTSTRTNDAVIANVSGLSSVVGELNITFDNLSNNFHVDGILRVGQASNIKLYTIAMQGAYTNPQSQLQLSFSGSAQISSGSTIRIIKVF